MEYKIIFRNLSEDFSRDFEVDVGQVTVFQSVGEAWAGFSRAVKQAGRCFDGITKVEITPNKEVNNE